MADAGRPARNGATSLPPARRAGDEGMSLIELMIVVAIVGILVSLSIGSYRTWAARYRVENDTKDLFMELVDARVRAMQRARVHFATVAGTNTLQIVEDWNNSPDGDGSLQAPPVDNLVRTRTTVNALAAPAVSPIRFNTDGSLATGGGGTFIRVTPPAGVSADYDCIALGPTRIKMGLFAGGTCVEK